VAPLRTASTRAFRATSAPLRFLPSIIQGQVTVARMVTLLDAIGIAISSAQVVAVLLDRWKRQLFVEEARDVLRRPCP